MAESEKPERRSLREGDMPDLMALVDSVGWNQTPEDWQFMLSSGEGVGITDAQDRVIACAVALPYENGIGWVGMVIVGEAWRRRGLASILVEDCIEALHRQGCVAGLDATPDGAEVYRRMGFSDGMRLTRWRRPGEAAMPKRMSFVEDLDWITRLDAGAFGSLRPKLVRRYADAGSIRVASGGGFLCHRPGRVATHIGPLCARNDSAALELLGAAVSDFPEPLIIDVPDHQAAVSDFLVAAGFVGERPFIRMFNRQVKEQGDPSSLYAIAGPELG